MLGKQSDLGGGEHPYLNHVGRDSFYGFLAVHQGELFSDEDFADLYCLDNGRPTRRPRRGRISTCAGRWPWESAWRSGPSPRARCSCFGRA